MNLQLTNLRAKKGHQTKSAVKIERAMSEGEFRARLS
jgi:hypothetical protein